MRSRRGRWERWGLGGVPFLRPFRCPDCGDRRLRWTGLPSRRRLLLLLAAILFGALLVQWIWIFRAGARRYRDRQYQPRDMERYYSSQGQRER